MDCSRFEGLLDARRAGELGADLARDVDAHVARCVTCRMQMQAIEDVARAMKGLERPEPPQLTARITREARTYAGSAPASAPAGVTARAAQPALAAGPTPWQQFSERLGWSSAPECPSCQAPIGQASHKCECCRAYMLGRASASAGTQLRVAAVLVLALGVIGGTRLMRPASDVRKPVPPVVDAHRHVPPVVRRPEAPGGQLPWSSLANNPYASHWEAEPLRSDLWQLDGETLSTAGGGLSVLWWKQRTRGDVEVELDAKLLSPHLKTISIVAHASRKLAVEPTMWPWDSGLWGQLTGTPRSRFLLGRLTSDFSEYPYRSGTGPATEWRRLRFRLQGKTITLWCDGVEVATRTSENALQDDDFDRVGLVLNFASVRNLSARRLDSEAAETTPALQGERWFYPFHGADKSGVFVRQANGTWLESKWHTEGGPLTEWARFEEVSRTEDYLELHDAGRQLTVRLSPDRAVFREARTPAGTWWELFPGSWKPE